MSRVWTCTKKGVGVAVLLLIFSVISGCCSDEEKQELKDHIEETFHNWRAYCREDFPPGSEGLTTCLNQAYAWYGDAKSKYTDYLIRCSENRPVKQLIKDIFKKVPDHLLNHAKVFAAGGEPKNAYATLPSETQVSIDLVSQSPGISAFEPVVILAGDAFLPDASANAIRDIHPSAAAVIDNIPTTTHTVSTGTASILYGNTNFSFTVNGNLDISTLSPLPNDAYRGIVTRVSLDFLNGNDRVRATLVRSSPFNDLSLDSNGNGRLRFLALLDGTGPFADAAAIVDRLWVTLPVSATIVGDTVLSIHVDTGAGMVGIDTVAPSHPSSIADFDRNGIVDINDLAAYSAAAQANDPLADLNGDEEIDQLDHDCFMEAWNA